VFYRLPWSSGEACVAATAAGAIAFDCTAPHRVVRPFRGGGIIAVSAAPLARNGSVTFESWCERDHLIALDFDPSVRGVAKPPFTTRFAAAEGGQQKHAGLLRSFGFR
jgi:hypothetical protein